MKKKFNKKGSLAITQILILIIGIVAVSYALGSGVGVVSGQIPEPEFTYNNIKFVIKSQTKIVQKGAPVEYILQESGTPCTTRWFWDVNRDGEWGDKENEYFEEGSVKVCMLEGFVTAMQGAEIPEAEEEEDDEEEGEDLSDAQLRAICKGYFDQGIYANIQECIKKKGVPPPTFKYKKGDCAKWGELLKHCCVLPHVLENSEYDTAEECIKEETKIYNDQVAAAAGAPAVVTTPQGPGKTWADREYLLRELAKKLEEATEEGRLPGETQEDYEYRIRELAKKLEEATEEPTPEDEDGKPTWSERLDICSQKVKDGLYGTLNECMKALREKPGAGIGVGAFLTNLWQSAAFAASAYTTTKLITSLIAPEAEGWYDPKALSFSIGVGAFVGKGIHGAIKEGGRLAGSKLLTLGGMDPLLASGIWGIATAALIYALLIREKNQLTVVFECVPWQSSTGGSHCEECNKQGILPCSEYQCRSLGQSCELLNKGTDEEKCAWVNRNDINFPTIEAWDDALLEDHEYETQDTGIMPPDTGVKIINKTGDECIKAFTPLSFGVTLNEPAKCKIDILRKDNFDDMNFYFSGGLSLYNHSYALSLPGSSALESEGIEIENEGEYELYVRCQDANGNSNTANFVFKFCVEPGPDTTPPLIVGTTPLNNMPFAYNKTSIYAEVYVNEPADCRWSHSDQSYDTMEDDTVHQMTCSSSIFEMGAQMVYRCSTTLTGLKDRQENKFYFRCKDQPGATESDRNVNAESYKYILIGTQPLVIDWVKPEEGSIIKDSTESVKVTLEAKTSAGYNEGKSNCYFSDTGDEDDYVLFLGDGDYEQYQHSQDLWLPEKEESYTYYIKCIDLGGNPDYETVSFEVDTDLDEPIVVRAYHEETYLKLVTNEPARCVYDTKYESLPCDYSFDDGTPMTAIEDVNHYTDWNTQTTFYIICQDEYGRQPAYGECSKIIRPFEVY